VTTLQIDGSAVSPLEFCDPEMSLSSARSGMIAHRFEIAIDWAEVVDATTTAYGELIRELRGDDSICGGPQDDLARADYPPLDEVLQAPPLVDLVFTAYLGRELLRSQTWDRVTPIRYWLDEVDNATYEAGNLILRGACYSQGDGVRRPLRA